MLAGGGGAAGQEPKLPTLVVAAVVAPAETKLLLDKVVVEHKLKVVLEDLVTLEMETLEV